MIKNWNRKFIFSMIGSLLCFPIFTLIYSSFKWSFPDDEMYGQYNNLFKSLSFWITIIVITFFAILPDILYSVLETSIRLRDFKQILKNKNKENLLM